MSLQETKNCPFCGGKIMVTAKKCKHCSEWLEEDVNSEKKEKPIYANWWFWVAIAGVILSVVAKLLR
jgi:predicted nucleic acid-binding Zn ribbon protein